MYIYVQFNLPLTKLKKQVNVRGFMFESLSKDVSLSQEKKIIEN